MNLTALQCAVLAELTDAQILGLADAPEYWISGIRDGQGCGTVRGEWPGRVFRKTYRWGLAVTAEGDYFSERKQGDPAHAGTLTWKRIQLWAESLPAELRADARRARTADDLERRRVVDALLGRTECVYLDGAPSEPRELTLW
ncbi:hypothetical protein LRM64_10105 [Prescottella equi]|uniref:hypothetical protein n=1 Tax=Rhodococcus hoagii TaxID=43767 RepID=UPI0019DD7282|nr:hypothetical protein [Prescottella equi]MBM4592250.1 hypothetical protein [Prescottella equi]MCU7531899.1 hypothetical protein [Prescottella equi]MCU7534031.1 hypothetical protein [Prescottella equi]NKW13281.1 hypothetical protein [Prescottella equi]